MGPEQGGVEHEEEGVPVAMRGQGGKPTIALGISHTPWVPARVESMARLRRGLGIESSEAGLPLQVPSLVAYREFSERCPNWLWSGEMWRWAAETTATHCLFLQDDDTVAPNFWPALSAMLATVPDQVVSLYNGHPGTMTLAREQARWYTTADGLVGQAYLFPRELLAEFLAWRRYELRPRAFDTIDEDSLIDVWAVHQGRRIWHPVVTLYDHDLSIASSFGNDHHEYRGPAVTWKDGDVLGFSVTDLVAPEWWVGAADDEGRPLRPHLGRFYRNLHWLARTSTRSGLSDDRIDACEDDVCPPAYKRFFTR
jgi:hypothetical protein